VGNSWATCLKFGSFDYDSRPAIAGRWKKMVSSD
jgi:hypothetical protein